MKKLSYIIHFLLLVSCTTHLFAAEIVEGSYIGWKKLPDLSPQDKSEVWYHEHNLSLVGGKVTMTVAPRVIKNGELYYSSSDGGFFKLKGAIKENGNKHEITIKTISCDYCAMPVNGWKEEKFPVIIINETSFTFNKVTYVLQKRP